MQNSEEQTYQQIKHSQFADEVVADFKRANPEASEDTLAKIREVVARLFDENGNFVGDDPAK